MSHRVFVYGTLKRGQPNYHRLTNVANGVSKFLGEAKLNEKYPMVIASEYNIPFLLDKPGAGNEILGEVFDIDDEMLKHLDWLENHPNLYQRTACQFIMLTGADGNNWEHTELLSGEMYLLRGFKQELLSLPYLSDYCNVDKKYVLKEQRDKSYSVIDAVKEKKV